MKKFSVSPGAKFVFGFVVILLLPVSTFAQYRVVVEPSVDIVGIHDDNLFLSDDERPASDFIQRVRPALDVVFDSPRWTARATYNRDSERFASHPGLNNARAREQALIDVRYQASPRLTLELDGSYLDTNTPSELNVGTGLAHARMSAQQIGFRPSARLRISPRLVARASSLSTTATVTDGLSMRAHAQTMGIERTITARDALTVDYEQGRYIFDQAGTTSSYVLLTGWNRTLGPRTRMTLQAGPRVTDGSAAPEISASVTHDWQFASIAISAHQTQTTIVGFRGTVEARNVGARVFYTPTRSLSVYAEPAIYRTTHQNLQATVYRIGLGARYAVTPMMGVDIAYSFDRQNGSIDLSRANSELARGMLSVNLTTRWNSESRNGTGRMR